MKKSDLSERIDEIFEHPENLDMKQMESFIHEMLGFFESLKDTLVTGSEEEKKEALATAQDIQTKLQAMAKKAYEKTGMSEEDIQKFLATGSLPPSDELKLFQNAQQELKDFKDKHQQTPIDSKVSPIKFKP
jgi:hypothetical protein